MFFKYGCLVVAQFIFVTAVTLKNLDDVNGGGTINLVNLGAVDGKNMFAENTTRTWTEARQYCVDLGMKLATITSDTQVAFLKAHFNATTFFEHHWISARDAQDQRALLWDETGSEIANLTTISWENHAPSFLICGALNAESAAAASLHLHLCSEKLKVLCET